MHTFLAQNRSFSDYDYPIFLAEVVRPSTKKLLTHHLLEQTKDPKCARI